MIAFKEKKNENQPSYENARLPFYTCLLYIGQFTKNFYHKMQCKLIIVWYKTFYFSKNLIVNINFLFVSLAGNFENCNISQIRGEMVNIWLWLYNYAFYRFYLQECKKKIQWK